MTVCVPFLPKALFADRRGITSVEYAVLALGIIPIIGIAATSLGVNIVSLFTAVTAVFH